MLDDLQKRCGIGPESRSRIARIRRDITAVEPDTTVKTRAAAAGRRRVGPPPSTIREATMLSHQQHPDDLDPRRRPRGVRRDWKSVSATVVIGRMPELLAKVLVRLGLAR